MIFETLEAIILSPPTKVNIRVSLQWILKTLLLPRFATIDANVLVSISLRIPGISKILICLGIISSIANFYHSTSGAIKLFSLPSSGAHCLICM